MCSYIPGGQKVQSLSHLVGKPHEVTNRQTACLKT